MKAKRVQAPLRLRPLPLPPPPNLPLLPQTPHRCRLLNVRVPPLSPHNKRVLAVQLRLLQHLLPLSPLPRQPVHRPLPPHRSQQPL